MTNQSPIVSHQGIPRTYTVAVSEESIKHRNSWQGYWDLIRLRINFDSFMSASEFQSFDRDGNARSPNNAWVKVELPWQRIIRRIRWQNGHTTGRARRFTLQGSNDNHIWTNLRIINNIPADSSGVERCEFVNDDKYFFYRFIINEVHPWRTGSNVTHYAILESFSMCCEVIEATGIEIVEDDFSLAVREQKQLTARVIPWNTTYKDVLWVSNSLTASVDKDTGLVTGVREGRETSISARVKADQSIRTSRKVTVGAPSPDLVRWISIANYPTEPLRIGVPHQLGIKITPDTALDKRVFWDSEKNFVARVSQNGLITPIHPGETTITAISECDNSITDRWKVTVAKRRVAIEVGHGGSDGGANRINDDGVRIYERDICLVVALELRRQLERHDVQVFLSRENNNTPDLAMSFPPRLIERNFMPDVGISVHTNDSGSGGFEVFHQTNEREEESKKLCQAIVDEMSFVPQTLRNPPIKNPLTSDLPRGKEINEFMDLIHAPFAYCELGFLRNNDDYEGTKDNFGNIINLGFDTEEKQKRFGIAYARGILKYLGIRWIP